MGMWNAIALLGFYVLIGWICYWLIRDMKDK